MSDAGQLSDIGGMFCRIVASLLIPSILIDSPSLNHNHYRLCKIRPFLIRPTPAFLSTNLYRSSTLFKHFFLFLPPSCIFLIFTQRRQLGDINLKLMDVSSAVCGEYLLVLFDAIGWLIPFRCAQRMKWRDRNQPTDFSNLCVTNSPPPLFM